MRKFFILFTIIFMTVSCGNKVDTGKASFKLKLGNIANATASYFPGGLMIAGHRLDDSQSFTLALTDGLQLELQKGAWEFATIGWTNAANGPMTGPQQCSYQQAELRDDNQTVTFNMGGSTCISAKGVDGIQFTDTPFLNLSNGSGTIGFKSLTLNVCSSFDAFQNCTLANGSSTINSLKVSIPSELKGVSVNVAPSIISNCFPVTYGQAFSSFTLPYGGDSGFLRTNISLYNSSDCTGSSTQISYPHGFAEPILGISNMSFYPAYSNLDKINYLGNWSVASSTPVGLLKGDTYSVSTTMSVFPYAYNGNNIYWNGISWVNIYSIMTLIDGLPYIVDGQTYLYIKQ